MITVQSKILELEEVLLDEQIAISRAAPYKLVEKNIKLNKSPIEVSTQQLIAQGYYILHAKAITRKTITVASSISGGMIVSQFVHTKPLAETPIESQEKTSSKHNLHFINKEVEHFTLYPGLEYHHFLLVMSKDYYFNHIHKQFTLHQSFVKYIEQDVYGALAKEDLPISIEIQHILDLIIYSSRTGEQKYLYIEAKIIELLLCQIEQISLQQKSEIKGINIPRMDICRVEQACQILRERYIDPPTVIALAREVLINDCTLKKVFKARYGSTIHHFVTRLRMEEAKNLLQNSSYSIGEIALQLGYKYQANFSEAFKKHYGYPPKVLRKLPYSNSANLKFK